MNCLTARHCLSQADTLQLAALSPEVAEHLGECQECQGSFTQLVRLEQAWRDSPLPVGAERVRNVLLARIAERTEPRTLPLNRPGSQPRQPRRWLRGARSVLAASTLLLLGLGLLLFGPGQTQAASRLIDMLIDDNLTLAEIPSLAERSHFYERRIKPLDADLHRANLSAEEWELAGRLKDNAAWLVRHDDPIDQAERFQSVANHTLHRMGEAAKKHKSDLAHRRANQYQRLSEKGVKWNLDRARTKPLDPDKMRKLERILRRDAERIEQLVEVLDKVPETSSKELRGVLKLHEKRHKPHRGGKKMGK